MTKLQRYWWSSFANFDRSIKDSDPYYDDIPPGEIFVKADDIPTFTEQDIMKVMELIVRNGWGSKENEHLHSIIKKMKLLSP